MSDDLIRTLDDPLEKLRFAMTERAAEARDRGYPCIMVIIKDATGHEWRFRVRVKGVVRHEKLLGIYDKFIHAPQPIILDIVVCK